jgi:hypothetical protein
MFSHFVFVLSERMIVIFEKRSKIFLVFFSFKTNLLNPPQQGTETRLVRIKILKQRAELESFADEAKSYQKSKNPSQGEPSFCNHFLSHVYHYFWEDHEYESFEECSPSHHGDDNGPFVTPDIVYEDENDSHDEDHKSSDVHETSVLEDSIKSFHVELGVKQDGETENGEHHAHYFGEKKRGFHESGD